jgi:molecular chaperone DnaK
MTDLVGRQLGNYRLLRKLGSGTFGEVYMGEHVHLKTFAAIKVLRDRLAGGEMEAFLSEARSIARLQHPHIVLVLDFAVEKNIPFFVMDYASNGTLRGRHPRGTPLPSETIVSFVKQIADALQYAHDEKLIHRDVKPENILLGQHEEILLSDFGIATIAQSSGSMKTQDIAGTVLYMAPEQIQGKPRYASDQYALGIIIYQWLTGTTPFRGSHVEIVTQHLTVPPPPLRTIVSTIPVEVEQVVLTALAKDPKRRFGSVRAFANALEQAYKIPLPFADRPNGPPPPRQPKPEPPPKKVFHESASPRPQYGRSKVIGIDLGTTNSCVAVMENGVPTVIPNAEGARITPSIVAFTKKGLRLVGEAAKRQAVINPENTIYSIKRFLGRKYDDPQVDHERHHVPYKVVRASNGDAWVEVQGKQYSPQEISAMILQKLKTDAEVYLGAHITQAVITVPSYFNHTQRQATKDAGRIAGLEVLRIINEPTAASLAYGLEKKKDGRIAVYDLGGGTFNISILELGEGVFEVKSTSGDTHLGGDDFDHRIIDWMANEFHKGQGINLRQDGMALQRLKEAAEQAKKELSSLMQTEINLPFITRDTSGPKHLNLTLTRSKLEELVKDLIEKSRGPVMKALSDASIRPGDFNEVVLVGGQTRMPAVQTLVRRIFDRELKRHTDLSEAVAIGAAIQSGVLTGDVKDVLLLDVTPFSLGIETLGGVFTRLIERNTTIPIQKSQVFSTALDEKIPNLSPKDDSKASVEIKVLQSRDESAKDSRLLGSLFLEGISLAPRDTPQIEVIFDINAKGFLSVLARETISESEQKMVIDALSILSKGKRDRKVLCALGIEIQTVNFTRKFTRLIDPDTIIPVKKSQIFSMRSIEPMILLPTILPPLSKNQTSVEINILQGEREVSKDNYSLGSFILDGIPSAPGGAPQIEVTLDIDTNGILNASARDKGTGREQKIILIVSSGLSKDQIERMAHDAELYATESRLRKEEVEEHNLADSAVYRAEKKIVELGDTISVEQKIELQFRIADVRLALSTDNITRIKLAREALEQAFSRMNEAIYHRNVSDIEFPSGE